MATMKDLEARLAQLEADNAGLRTEVEQLRREREPAPPPVQQRWRKVPGQGNREFDENGNERVPAGTNALGPPEVQRTAPGILGVTQLGAGNWRAGDGIVRDAEGAVVTLARPSPTNALGGPQRSYQHEQAIAHVDRLTADYQILPQRDEG